MQNWILALVALLGVAMPADAGQNNCGGPVACEFPGGDYRIAMPNEKVSGVYVFFHGYGGSADAQMRQKELVDTVLAHHLAFVALDGDGGNWLVPGAPREGRDDQDYLTAVLDDLKLRHGFLPENTVIGGFSLGASMAWYAACEQGNRFAGMVTFSGVFWDPLPKPADCMNALPPMIHIHGQTDGTFPLAGRAIGPDHHQGDAFKSVAIYRQRAACKAPAQHKPLVADMDCEVASDCLRGESMLCLHRGGHVVRIGDLDAALTAIGYPS